MEYKIEINLEGAYWEVYRRYSDFSHLDKNIRMTLGDIWCEENNFKPKLPGKDLPYAISGDTVDKRIPLLNDYMSEMLGFTPPEDKKNLVKNLLRAFLDMDNRGKSGIRVSMELQAGRGGPANTVLRESFALVSRPTSFNLIYQACFIALTSHKVLYVCSKVYDRAPQAKHVLALDTGGFSVTAVSQTRFDLKSLTETFQFCFINENDAAHWMRAVGDATLQQTMARTTEASRRSDMQRAQAENEATRKAAEGARPQVHEYHGSVGGTTDQLSTQFGV